MEQLTSAGRQKIEAARAAGTVFLDQLRLAAGDRAGIVKFNADAELLQPLTADRVALETALDRLAVRQQTRIDRGLYTAATELTRAPRNGVASVIVLLSDGRANPVGPEVAEHRASEAKAKGISIYVIGLGDDIDAGSLERIANRPEYFYRAPDGEDLATIYRTIAAEIPCPASAFWPRR